ncbi:hypothetical protein L7F22_034684 [Adiantum nelumboides]|nr:hypothetical protein [Adiantum nelumboides]
MKQLRAGAGSLRETVFGLLQAESKDLNTSRNMYSLIIKAGLDSVRVLADHLIRLFATCSSLPEVLYIFAHVQRPSLYTWNSIISAHIQLGCPQGALSLHRSMPILPDQVTIANVLKATIDSRDIHAGRHAHTHITLHGIPLDFVIGGTLVDFYAKLGTIEEASRVFCALPSHDIVSWGAMLSGFLQHGQFYKYLQYLGNMQHEGIQPNKVVFLLGLKACSSSGVLRHGLSIHFELCKLGFEKDPYMQSILVEMYSKCGLLEEAESIFKGADCIDIVLWSSMLGAQVLCSNHELAFKTYEQMLANGISPDKVVFLFLLQACGNAGKISEGFQVHNWITLRSLEKDVGIENTLISMYAKCGNLIEATGIFHHMGFRDEVSWINIISGYINHGRCLCGVELFASMQLEGFCPNSYVITCILTACEKLLALEEGRFIHECAIKLEIDDDLYVSNALVHMYSRLDSLTDSQIIFDRISKKDMASWSSIMSGYAEHGRVHDVLNLLNRMQLEGLQPDEGILICILSACGSIGALQEGSWIYHLVLDYGMGLDTRLACEIVNMYFDCGRLQDAQAAFDGVAKPDVALWSALIAGYCEYGEISLAEKNAEEMLKGEAELDETAYLSLFQVCCELGSVDTARLLHSQIVEVGFDCNLSIQSSALNMYVKCRSMEDAEQLFTQVKEQDLVLMSSMLSGFAMVGNNEMVAQCFKNLEQESSKVKGGLFTAILHACSCTGLLQDGCQFFHQMSDSLKLIPSVEHYNCIVDLLGRVGYINDAIDVLQTVPSPISLGCTSLLKSCHTYGDQGSRLEITTQRR